MSYLPNARTDLYARTRMPVATYTNGTETPEGTTVVATYPVVGWATDGTPLIALAAGPGAIVTNGRMTRASDFPDYELCVIPAARSIPTPNASAVVEVITGSDEELIYTLPDGSKHRGVIPLWGRCADGSLVALLTAEAVPHVRTIERDEHGEIVGVIEE